MFNANPNIGILDPFEAKTVTNEFILESASERAEQFAQGRRDQEIDQVMTDIIIFIAEKEVSQVRMSKSIPLRHARKSTRNR